MTSEAVRAHYAGYVARMDNRPYEANPYPADHLGVAWGQGWREADREIIAKRIAKLPKLGPK